MKSLFFTALLLFTLSVVAQNKKGCNCKFLSVNNIGLMEGGHGSAFQLQTVNGVAIRKWFIGLGTGIDYYRFRSVPLFLETEKEFSDKNISPFLYAAAGLHFPWKRDDDEMYYFNGDVEGGLYYDAGVGLHFSTRKTNGFTISAGYSFKKISESIRMIPYCLIGPCVEYEQNREYGLKRISMKVGWRFRSL